MKKLLLALVLLAGVSLPSLARDCDQYYLWLEKLYGYEEGIKRGLFEMVVDNDLECVSYYADEKGVQLDELLYANPVKFGTRRLYSPDLTPDDTDVLSEPEDIYPLSLIGATFYRWSEASPELLSFLISHEVKANSHDIYEAISEVGVVFDFNSPSNPKIYDSLPAQKLKVLLNEGGSDIWKNIDEKTIDKAIRISITRSPSFIKFLIDNGMPITECDRYIEAIKRIIKSSYLAEDQFKQNREDTLALLEDAKVARFQVIHENIRELLEKINNRPYNDTINNISFNL